MIRGVYTSASGMVAGQHRMDVAAHNTANVQTPGYKRQSVHFAPFLDLALVRSPGGTQAHGAVSGIGTANLGARLDAVLTDYAEGPLQFTGRDKDIALAGKGFFVVAEGENVLYTRAGSLKVDEEGALVTASGHYLLGENGRIEVPGNPKLVIAQDGRVLADGELVDHLRVAFFEDESVLQRAGDGTGLFALPEGAEESLEPGRVLVMQHYLEGSNVDLAREMADIIVAARTYAANQRIVTTHDSLLEKVVNQVGLVR
ncbi:MAG: flagellar hook-basal body protein [Desulforudis sp.]|nr:MAG: flagellar hook-basal body protein [Desulforudis sp.]